MYHTIALLSLALVSADRSFGQSHASTIPHIRPEVPELRRLLDDAVLVSPTLRALVDRIEISDVIVYIAVRPLPYALEGRIGWIGAGGGTRCLKIELACPRSKTVLTGTLAHERRHAVEIADAIGVRDTTTLERLYSTIGTREGDQSRMRFETAAARAAGERARREIRAAERRGHN